jgi:hypothetical protein
MPHSIRGCWHSVSASFFVWPSFSCSQVIIKKTSNCFVQNAEGFIKTLSFFFESSFEGEASMTTIIDVLPLLVSKPLQIWAEWDSVSFF